MTARDRSQPPRFVILVGAGRVGKDTVGQYLKLRHGFAKASFARPLYDAIGPLYGVMPCEYLFGDKDAPITRLGRSVRELLQHLGDQIREEAGPDILIRRLVERSVARGEWMQTDLVITDARADIEIEWARQQGAIVWWVRRPGAPDVRPHHTESIAALHLKQFRDGDFTIVNEGTPEALYQQVDSAIAATRTVP